MERYEIHNNWKVDKFQEHIFIAASGNKSKGFYAECLLCGSEQPVRYYDVKSGKSKQCKSCSTSITWTKHGDSKTRLHNVWLGMKARCYNEAATYYKSYGANGVTVCDEWLNSYETFKNWAINNGYEDNLTIDKDILCDKLNIHPKIYSPETCHFITLSENIKYARENDPVRNKTYLLNMSIAQRDISDNDIVKIRKMLSIDLEYKDIVKVVDTHFATISRIKDGSFMTVKELRDQIEEIV